jgi:hypothetical protein
VAASAASVSSPAVSVLAFDVGRAPGNGRPHVCGLLTSGLLSGETRGSAPSLFCRRTPRYVRSALDPLFRPSLSSGSASDAWRLRRRL